MKSLRKLLTGLLLFSLSFTLLAEDVRYYDVEVILFENLDKKARESENWPSSVELDRPENTVEIGQPAVLPLDREYEPKMSFTPLAAQEYRLNSQASKIEESVSRRILLHTGWHQPGLAVETAIPVYFKRTIPAAGTATTETGQAESNTPAPPSRYVQPEAGELEGLIKVILARYLHVTTDIIFQPEEKKTDEFTFGYEQIPALNEPRALNSNSGMDMEEETEMVVEEEQPVVYLMRQTRRRMRSRELHYLDNPVIGMLILITPHEPLANGKKP